MPAPAIITELVERFEANREAYTSGKYNETQLRREFVDPFFKALGWDVWNERGYAEAYKEVVHEEAIRIGGETGTPDYRFRIGEGSKFLLEAKRPSVDIKGDPAPAYQLRRYAWSAGLPLNILTNFGEFAVYDGRVKPAARHKASIARILYLTCDEYLPRWDEIAAVFSRDAVLKGSFDRYAEATRRKGGTAEVDAEFLKEIEAWRDVLARNLALRNPDLSQRDLNFAVQATIDRIIFLRICEARGVEPYGRLQALLNGERVYPRLFQLFQRADERYNSGLFHFTRERDRPAAPDTLTPSLEVDDKPLKDILRNLYYPDSPYEFSVLPADILGHVYEQFLGKVIRLTAGHHAVVEEKPEVRKAGGVYYTPTYIVDYLVHRAVGPLLSGRTPQRAASLRILDPACGSGSFLLGAYQYLLNWHLDWYTRHHPEQHAKGRHPALYQAADGGWRLTTGERKRILLNSVYGVDIDPQAVEVTKLALLLKVLEGESGESLQRIYVLFHQRALPDLSSNIKCGNSLIGSDFYRNHQGSLFDEEETFRINPFDWEAGFPNIIAAGGFDAVIGNPPWGAEFGEPELAFLRRTHQRVIARMIDSYIYFVDRAVRLVSSSGTVGFILPSTILNQVDAKPVRQLLLHRGLWVLLSLGRGIFGPKVLNTSTILVSKRAGPRDDFVLGDLSGIPLAERANALGVAGFAAWSTWKALVEEDPDHTFFVNNPSLTALLARLRAAHPPLKTAIPGTIQRGVSADAVAAHVVSKIDARREDLEVELLRNSVSGPQIKRYREWHSDQFIILTSRATDIRNYPNILRHLEGFRHQNSCKEVRQGKHPWWALHRQRDRSIFASPKFIGLTTSKTIELIYDPQDSVVVTDAMYVFPSPPEWDPWAFMAILQSKLFLTLYRTANQGESRVIPQVKASKLGSLPFPSSAQRQPAIGKISDLSKRMFTLYRGLARAKTEHTQTPLLRRIEANDREIDELVYRFYGLTEEEVEILEGTTGS